MSLLIPLGLLGLLGLLALILIYILKPNYQQKLISSTFVWKLSFKYRKKRVPISRLRNFLILLCQILIICCSAMILAQPAIVTDTSLKVSEKILVIDASADMFSEYEGETRFEKAVDKALDQVDEVFSNDGYVSVIWAGNSPYYAVQRADKSEEVSVKSALNGLQCSYGVADIDGAMALAESVLVVNPDAQVILYTGTHYANEGKYVTVDYVSEEGEWNAAILNATATLEDNYYVFTLEVAGYGADKSFDIICELTEVNGTPDSATLPVATVEAHGDETITVVYSNDAYLPDGFNTVYVSLEGNGIYAFNEMYIYIDEIDSISFDNEFYLYGAKRPTVKIEYFTTSPNPFYSFALKSLQNDKKLRTLWDISIKEIRGGEPELEGYDLYVFENDMPERLPSDGVVLMANPSSSADAGFTLVAERTIRDYSGDGVSLAPGVDHPIMSYIPVNYFSVTKYWEINESSLDGYDVLMYYEGNPVFFVRNRPESKVGVIAFGTSYSTANISFVFPMLIRNFFTYYFPTTFESAHYNVYDTVNFTARGTDISVNYRGENLLYEAGSEGSVFVGAPGTYEVTQLLMSGEYQLEKFYVTIPAEESNISKTEEVLTNPYVKKNDAVSIDDLLVWFAAALVALLFIEWLLQTREGI